MARHLRVWIARGLALSFIVGSSLGSGRPQQPSCAIASLAAARAAINDYCVECHNDRLKTAGLALDKLNLEKAGENPEVWEKVVRKLRVRMMPPLGKRRPDESTYTTLVTYLERSLDQAAGSNPNPARTPTLRRLSRSE